MMKKALRVAKPILVALLGIALTNKFKSAIGLILWRFFMSKTAPKEVKNPMFFRPQ